ncbi:OmpA family protein [Roseomonas sp. F4]
MRTALALLLALAATPALAQPRPFNCVGAEQLEDDIIAVPFAGNSTSLGPAGRSAVAAAVAAAKAEPGRMICVLGHADRRAGAETSTQIAARRARAVTAAMTEQGVERDRVRAEARVAAFSGRVREPGSRAVTIVLLPAAPSAPAPSAPAPSAPAPTAPAPTAPAPSAPTQPTPAEPETAPAAPAPSAPAPTAPAPAAPTQPEPEPAQPEPSAPEQPAPAPATPEPPADPPAAP